MSPTAISRRIQSAIQDLQDQDYESALVHYFPALDKSAKKRYPRAGVGRRIKSYLCDQEELITAIAFGNIFKGCYFQGLTLAEGIYKFGRTSISHEGQLDKRLKIVEEGPFHIGLDDWRLPVSCISALIISVMVAAENSSEQIDDSLCVSLFDKTYKANELWGKESELLQEIQANFGNKDA